MIRKGAYGKNWQCQVLESPERQISINSQREKERKKERKKSVLDLGSKRRKEREAFGRKEEILGTEDYQESMICDKKRDKETERNEKK